jgi:hypothetical protein
VPLIPCHSETVLISSDIDSIPSRTEKQRSQRLQEDRRCSHCGSQISLSDAISMVFGWGLDRSVKVQFPDGSIRTIHATEVNPQKVRVLE